MSGRCWVGCSFGEVLVVVDFVGLSMGLIGVRGVVYYW